MSQQEAIENSQDLALPVTATTAYIHLNALAHNLKLIKNIAPKSKLLAIVKANGYGHGAEKIARYADLADGFGVARLQEAIQLREIGIKQPILLLEGFYDPQDVATLAEYDLQTAVHCEEQLKHLEQANLDKPVQVWLKIDTGMHRLGVDPENVAGFKARLEACDNVAKPIHFISHFCCADESDSDMTNQQIACFEQFTTEQDCRSIAASAGILAWPQSHFDWVRPGIIMYGISPFADKTAQDLGFQPVMTLTSHLISVKKVKAGETVGYGASWQAPQDTTIGVIAIGYGDGYPRTAPNGTPVLINGRIVPIAGRVSMDMMTVDLGPDSQDKFGDEVELWGANLPVEHVAQWVGTIGYELVTQLTSRVVMAYQEN
ncbi:MAG: alanine racemase [Vibrio sp.]